MTKYHWGVNPEEHPSDIRLSNQTIDSGVVAKDPVYMSEGTWFTAVKFSPVPLGVYEGNNVVIVSGKLITTGLIAGKIYYLREQGNIGTGVTETKIGVAVSTAELIISIDSTRAEQGFISAYSGGGLTTVNVSTMFKLTFGLESLSSISSNLTSTDRNDNTGNHSETSGYFFSGLPGFTTEVDKLSFATETNFQIVSKTGVTRRGSGGHSIKDYGYTTGGGSTVGSVIEKLVFSTDATSTVSGNVGDEIAAHASPNGLAIGYNMGGIDGAVALSHIWKMTFSTETSADSTVDMAAGPHNDTQGFSWLNNAGYVAGGQSAGALTTIDKVLFSNDASTSVSTKMIKNHSEAGGTQTGTHGFTVAGTQSGLPKNNVVNKFNFITETNTELFSTTPEAINKITRTLPTESTN